MNPLPIKGCAGLFRRKLTALGLPDWYAVRCTLESVVWYQQTPRGRDLGWYLFSLRRAEYCRERYFARWGVRAGFPKIRKVSHG